MKHLHSAITTLQKEPSAQTGMRRGELGLETPENSRLVAWLAGQAPADVDKAAVLRASQLGVDLRVKVDYRFPKDERGNSLPVVMVVKGCDVIGTPEARSQAIDALGKLETPAPSRELEGWLAELAVITAKRVGDEFEETLRLEAYASRLRKYPADVARAALLDRSWRFWPSWAELEAVCFQLAAPRRAMLKAMQDSASETYREERERVSAERAAEIMREVFGGDA